jgi:hypothetical protein
MLPSCALYMPDSLPFSLKSLIQILKGKNQTFNKLNHSSAVGKIINKHEMV